ncbi:uncharacterized protein N7483_012232 [Penicillium malachiteum]|uniref:uncharacterized protein n=1 Tax=Penicillium malachiteum TaxID=1324776 RepID=UPI0025484B3D|nr:uncharacterized protein N7483_012232 [Penicillium malachiteum]KAJ5715051.1 hypothetical protein N7483_012232 [Penicillium malachiteum]
MVESTHVKVNVQPQEEVDLSDDQIQKLLLEAESRLRGEDVQLQEVDSSFHIPKLSSGHALEAYVRENDDIAVVDSAQLIDQKQKELSNSLHTTHQPKKTAKEKITAGPQWFDLPKTEMTTELKRDLQLLRMRSVLDAKRHYKKDNGKFKPPEFSQVGTIIEGATEFFSGRIVKKDRKKTFVAEAMALEKENRRFESKYRDIQTKKTSGKKAFYNDLKAKRNRTKK